ncbi:MAG: SRPBCC family protein [Minicystis sp.]
MTSPLAPLDRPRGPAAVLLAQRSFVTEVVVRAAPSAVLAALDDLPAFFRLNPLVVAVDRVAGETDTYVVTDRLRFLGVPFDFRYKARSVRVPGGLDSEVWASPATHLHNELRVLPEGASARVRETVRVTAPRPLAGYAMTAAQAAHRDLLNRLAARVEAGA